MTYLGHAFFATAIALSAPATVAAQDNPVVVELFTSQGCSSCPAADAILHDLAARDDVIALALHVDYWDYIGWKDPFGNPAHAHRQRAYAVAADRKSVYTPEIIVNGQTDIVGAKPMALSNAIAHHAAGTPQIDLSLTREGTTLSIAAQTLTPQANGPMTVHMLRYVPEQVTEITRGENAGKTIQYANVVEGWTELGSWQGDAPLAMSTDITGDLPVVVLIQAQDAGPILAARRLR